MKTRNTSFYGLLISNIRYFRLDKLFMAFLLSLTLIACGGNGSSNKAESKGGSDSTANNECSDGFGDASRCEARNNL